ncbi:hypothetical protein JHV675_50740 [Mycobacterium avium subsp. hominissuis]
MAYWALSEVQAPAADPVSLQTALGFSAQGQEHSAVAAQGVEELGRHGRVLLALGAETQCGLQ